MLGFNQNLFVLLFLLAQIGWVTPVYGQETDAPQEPSLQFELGGGEVRIEPTGVEIPDSVIQRLKTNLLVDDRISEVVTSQNVTRILLQGDEVSKLVGEVERASSRLADQLQEKTVQEITGAKPPGEAQEDDSEDADEPGEIYFAEDVHVSAQDKRDDLVVVAGDVNVEGRVHSLIVVGGDVNLAPGAEVQEDLLVIGGDVRLSAGSRVGDELVMVGGRLLSDPGSYVGSKRSITPKFRVGPEHWHGPHLWPHMWMAWWSSLLSGIIGFFLAWGVLVLLTQSAGDFLSLSRNLWREKKFVSSLSGLGVVLSFLPGLLFLVVTLVGILLVPVYLLAVAALTLVAYALIIDRLGHSFLVQQDLPLWKRVLMGQICWTVLSAVPFVGAIVIVGLWLLGLGVSIQAATRRFLAPA